MEDNFQRRPIGPNIKLLLMCRTVKEPHGELPRIKRMEALVVNFEKIPQAVPRSCFLHGWKCFSPRRGTSSKGSIIISCHNFLADYPKRNCKLIKALAVDALWLNPTRYQKRVFNPLSKTSSPVIFYVSSLGE